MLFLTGQSWRILKPGAQVAAKNKDLIAVTVPYKRLIDGLGKTNYERVTAQPTIKLTINDCLTVTIDESKRTHDITSVHRQ